jgi:hypothetical protein
MKAAVKELGVEPPENWLPETWNACTHVWHLGPELACIVCIRVDQAKQQDPIIVASLLTHEAVHVWQNTRRKIGGDTGDEMEAYAIQNISQTLFEAYKKAIGGGK